MRSLAFAGISMVKEESQHSSVSRRDVFAVTGGC